MRGLSLPEPPPAFANRKRRILEQLAVPEAEYTDASPKGSVDEGIRDLIAVVNNLDGFATTSSCAGRVSVFLEGSRRGAAAAGEEGGEGEGTGARTFAGVGGKGGGGAWLFVSHDPVPLDEDGAGRGLDGLLGLGGGEDGEGDDGAVRDATAARLVHFKFEPMILHVLTASTEHAQLLLRCGLQAGFRESGAVSLTAAAGEQGATPIVAIRSMGLSFESLVGFQSNDRIQRTISLAYLRTLVHIANERFSENKKRIERFQTALVEATSPSSKNGDEWEDARVRRERKKAEGLKRKEELRQQQQQRDDTAAADVEEALDIPLNETLM
ncbi:methyltransferase TYW3-domain-containing protein [Jackrogersella minutella]|nr:methyltransferase TYW3-domain-containing protein [Jackrogersella minutella]